MIEIQHSATAKMIEDVSTLVLAGQKVPTRVGYAPSSRVPYEQLINASRLVKRNKRKILIATASLVTVGVLTGGVAVGIAVAGKATGFVAGRMYRRWQMWGATGTFRRLFPDLINKAGEFDALQLLENGSTDSDHNRKLRESKAPQFAECMAAVEFMVAHRDFSDMANAYIDLMKASKDLQTRISQSNNLRNCQQAIELLESLYSLKYHYERLEAAFTFLDAYISYIEMRSRKIEEEFGRLAKITWAALKSSYDNERLSDWELRTYAGPLDYLNMVANSSAVLHTAGWLSNPDKRTWIKTMLHPYVQSGELEARTLKKGSNFLVDKERDLDSKMPMMLTSTAVGATASFALKQAIGGVTSAPSLSIETTVAAVTLGAVADKAASLSNSYQLEHSSTFGFTGWRELQSEDVAILLKTKVKASFPRLNRKFQHWEISHQEFVASVGKRLPEQCTAMLRSRKHWEQTVGSLEWKELCDLRTTLIEDAKRVNQRYFGSDSPDPSKEITPADRLQGAIDYFLGNHKSGLACSCEGLFCYMPVNLCLSQNGETAKNSDSPPTFPIGTSKFVEVY